LTGTAPVATVKASPTEAALSNPLPVPDPLEAPAALEDPNPFKGKTGLLRIWHAFHNSCAGLAAGWQESAFRQEVVLAAILIPTGLLVPVAPVERALLVAVVVLVLIVELLNSGIEAAIDRISLERHPLSKRAKDIGSAAVLISLLLVALVWGVILVPRLVAS
jgi:diacylglycerol kinase (ATP)